MSKHKTVKMIGTGGKVIELNAKGVRESTTLAQQGWRVYHEPKATAATTRQRKQEPKQESDADQA